MADPSLSKDIGSPAFVRVPQDRWRILVVLASVVYTWLHLSHASLCVAIHKSLVYQVLWVEDVYKFNRGKRFQSGQQRATLCILPLPHEYQLQPSSTVLIGYTSLFSCNRPGFLDQKKRDVYETTSSVYSSFPSRATLADAELAHQEKPPAIIRAIYRKIALNSHNSCSRSNTDCSHY